jgi:hypothetical protein
VSPSEPPCGIEPLPGERGFRPSGDLGGDSTVHGSISRAIEPELHRRLVLDLADLVFLGELGMSVVVRALTRPRERGGDDRDGRGSEP